MHHDYKKTLSEKKQIRHKIETIECKSLQLRNYEINKYFIIEIYSSYLLHTLYILYIYTIINIYLKYMLIYTNYCWNFEKMCLSNLLWNFDNCACISKDMSQKIFQNFKRLDLQKSCRRVRIIFFQTIFQKRSVVKAVYSGAVVCPTQPCSFMKTKSIIDVFLRIF